MQVLKEEFSKGDWSFKCLKRQGMVAIYERTDTEINKKCYEAIIIVIKPEQEKFGTVFPEREQYPSNEDFGKIAFCCATLQQAEERFNQLLNRKNAKSE